MEPTDETDENCAETKEDYCSDDDSPEPMDEEAAKKWNDVLGQVESILHDVRPELFEHISIKDYVEGGIKSQLIYLKTLKKTLKSSNEAARKCQAEIVPPTTSVETVFATQCFANIVTNIKTTLLTLSQSCDEYFKNANINLGDGVIQDLLALTEDGVIREVKKIIENPAYIDPFYNRQEVRDQIEFILNEVAPLFYEKIGLERFDKIGVGAGCTSIYVLSMKDLLRVSDAATRKCQDEMNPPATSVEAVATSQCFLDVLTTIHNILTGLEKPIEECLKKYSILMEDGVIKDILTLSEKKFVISVKDVIKNPEIPAEDEIIN